MSIVLLTNVKLTQEQSEITNIMKYITSFMYNLQETLNKLFL